jgi:hypothetical protein
LGKNKNHKFVFLLGGDNVICLFLEVIKPNLLSFQLSMQWLSDAIFHWAKQPQLEAFFVVLLSG